ncbi:class II aaRS and biotin synthetase [Choiromyces venosus 120613-1]|uniref:threonine--tRNA ligase n=1 Tax=Choiromyces venosus 120613-1 TaxID=1336337 RepID=A0A3N4K2H0_9PEZI|nr:class II aaRS and biotin synthetase [Choiromyces venosus 120613-1]
MRRSALLTIRRFSITQSRLRQIPSFRSIAHVPWSQSSHAFSQSRSYSADTTCPSSSSKPGQNKGSPPDHRQLAAAQDLLITHPVSPGSPLFLPRGSRVFNKLVSFIRSQYALYGYEEVITPTIYKKSLWETSGHWENYKEHMFKIEAEEEFGLKPMNCPGHCLLFKHAAGKLSLRDLPVRYADFSPLHRNENSGSLSGLTRVRRFHQDDAHIFCRPSQISQEILSTLQFIQTVYKVFRLPSFKLMLSTRPREGYIGSLEEWDRAEAALKVSLDESGQEWTINEGDGAFYGPKIDIILKDSDGKEHQTATIQLDFQLPRRFELTYLAPAPAAEQKGILSMDPEELSVSGLVRPHYNGKWPFWLSPRQAIVIPVAMTDEIVAYARAVRKGISGLSEEAGRINANSPLAMSRRTFNVDIDESGGTFSKKVRAARTQHYNYIIVVGEKNLQAKTVSLDSNFSWGQDQGDRERVKESPKDMSVEEVYQRFVELENEYA